MTADVPASVADFYRAQIEELKVKLVHRWTNARGHRIICASGRAVIALGNGQWAGDGLMAGEEEAPMFDSEEAALDWVTRGAFK